MSLISHYFRTERPPLPENICTCFGTSQFSYSCSIDNEHQKDGQEYETVENRKVNDQEYGLEEDLDDVRVDEGQEQNAENSTRSTQEYWPSEGLQGGNCTSVRVTVALGEGVGDVGGEVDGESDAHDDCDDGHTVEVDSPERHEAENADVDAGDRENDGDGTLDFGDHDE